MDARRRRSPLAPLSLLGLLGVLACGGGQKSTEIPASNKPLTAKDIVQRSSPAIVRIEAQGADGEQFGTGFIVDKTGVVATNLHVIAGVEDVKVKLHDGTLYPVQAVLNVDPLRDLVLVKVAPAQPLPTLRLGDSNKVATGDQIVAIGNPLGVFENTVSEGLVSSVREICSKADVQTNPSCPGELTLLQISAPISQGSSGGPLFNQVGEVVGITTAIIERGQLINLAMPANYLKPLLAKLEPIAIADFAKATRKDDEPRASKIQRAPYAQDGFPTSVYDGCSAQQIGEVVKAIQDAIEIGAPLYNKGEIEACFRIYEGTATKMERDAPCKGVRTTFGDGLLKAGALPDFKAKAWAMRDTFDGFLIAAEKWIAANGGAKDAPKKPKK